MYLLNCLSTISVLFFMNVHSNAFFYVYPVLIAHFSNHIFSLKIPRKVLRVKVQQMLKCINFCLGT